MTLLPQLERELTEVARRPAPARQIAARMLAVLVAAIAALLVVTPPSVAQLPGAVAAITARATQ